MVARVPGPTGSGFRPAARAGAGRAPSSPAGPGARAPGEGRRRPGAGSRLACPRPPGSLIPVCRVCGGDRAGVGAPCAPPQHPDYIYQRVVSPRAPTTPSPITQSGQGGPSRENKSGISPPPLLFPGSGPLHPGLAGASNPRSPARSERFGPSGACSGPGCAPGNQPGCSRGAQGAPPRHHRAYSPRSERGSGFGGGRPRRPGDAGTANPPPRPTPTTPAPLCRTRPTSRSLPPPSPPALTPAPWGTVPGRPPAPRPHLCRRRPS